MSDFKELLQFVWEDLKAPDVSYLERVVLFGVPIVVIIATVELIAHVG